MVFSKHMWLCAIKSRVLFQTGNGFLIWSSHLPETDRTVYNNNNNNNNNNKDSKHDLSLVYFEIYFSCVFNLLLLINRYYYYYYYILYSIHIYIYIYTYKYIHIYILLLYIYHNNIYI